MGSQSASTNSSSTKVDAPIGRAAIRIASARSRRIKARAISSARRPSVEGVGWKTMYET
jgi:hypothetical protein